MNPLNGMSTRYKNCGNLVTGFNGSSTIEVDSWYFHCPKRLLVQPQNHTLKYISHDAK